MADNGGISGLAVAVAAIGGFLVYAGIQDVDTISGLREILSGKTPTGRAQKSNTAYTTVAGSESASSGGSVVSTGLVAEARKHLGKPYVWAAVGPDKFDCSGLVIYCLRKTYNAATPRFTTHTFAAWARSQGFSKVAIENVAAGDIVLKSGHMGIAISNTEMIHAPNRRTVVKISKIYSPMYMWSGWRLPATTVSQKTKGAI